MYQVQNSVALLRQRRLLGRRSSAPLVSRTVVLLGLTSLFTDVSSEMVAAVLPLFLIYTVGLTPLQFGVLDGIYQGASALVRIAGGFVADRQKRHKEMAVAGYGISAFCKLGLLVAGGAVGALTAIILLDRTGKGIRTAPRDALISLSTPRDQLATAFGVHRALDTMGALLGPLLAFGILALAPLAFDTVFAVSFCIALVGLGIIVLFVENRPRAAVDASERVSARAAAALLKGARFRMLVIVGGLLGLVTISDGFVFLVLQRQADLELGFFPLLYVGTALAYMVLAVPAGRLADRFGRVRVFVGGYALLLAVYASLLVPGTGTTGIVGALLLLGAYYAATEGVLMALASAVLPPELRASGLAVLVTATSIARLLASILFGAAWTAFGLEPAIAVFSVALVVAAAAALVLARRSPEPHAA
jgi:MFS family permease